MKTVKIFLVVSVITMLLSSCYNTMRTEKLDLQGSIILNGKISYTIKGLVLDDVQTEAKGWTYEQTLAHAFEIEKLVKKATVKYGGEIFLKEAEISEEVTKKFNASQKGDKVKVLSLMVSYSAEPEIVKSLTQCAVLKMEIEAEKLRLQRDSLISEFAKRDAKGYTSEAERLESRRDSRHDSRKSLDLQEKSIESNERVQKRKSEAVEKAADNIGYGRTLVVTQ